MKTQPDDAVFEGRIESLRGIAAMMVAVAHSLIVLSVGSIQDVWRYSLLEINGGQAFLTRLLLVIFNGNVAVTIFFVISGFVLSLSLDRRNPQLLVRYPTFILARAFRLYPALILCVIVIAVYWKIRIAPTPITSSSDWYRGYHPEVTFSVGWKETLLFGRALNPVAWSVQVEMAAAFALPLLHLISKRRNIVLHLCAVIFLLTVGAVYSENLVAPQLFVFYMGLTVPSTGRRIIEALATSSLYSLLIYLSIAMIALPLSLTGEPSLRNRLIEASGAFIFISAMLYGPNRKIFTLLDLRSARFYGKISYSFYLYHFFLMFAFSQILLPQVPSEISSSFPLPLGLALAAISVAVATVAASLSYRFLERPGINVGKRLSKWLFRPRLPRPVGINRQP